MEESVRLEEECMMWDMGLISEVSEGWTDAIVGKSISYCS